LTTTLVVSEKPDAAKRIAESLSDKGQVLRQVKRGVPIYEVSRPNEKVYVCSALGHLYSVDQKQGTTRRAHPVWDLTWKPMYLTKRGQERLQTWIDQIRQVSREADCFVNACDYDIEGSVIGAMVLKYACNGADRSARRMKFSTLTTKELQEAYANSSTGLDHALVEAGMCRHEVDWVYGINLSRVLTDSAREHGRVYSTLSTGRVQGPTLRFIVDREDEINCFVPSPYWTIETIIKADGSTINAQYEKERIDSKSEADKVVINCEGESGTITDIDSRTSKIYPPPPFDLSALQAEAYRHFGLRPSSTLGIAERLYLDALISYPRTSSQKLPPSIEYRKILENLSSLEEYAAKVFVVLSRRRLSPTEGQRSDPAHPAIYPTGNMLHRALEPRERKVYDLIVRRFVATFGDPAIRQSEKVSVSVKGCIFYLKGIRILAGGWTDLYEPYAGFEEVPLPSLRIGQIIDIVRIVSAERSTQPPSRFNPSSLLRLMEKENIGTKATRAEMIDTLYNRGYIVGERMTPTPLALNVIDVLKRYCSKVVETGFTRELEEKMQSIEYGKERKERVLVEAIENLRPVMAELEAGISEVGTELGRTIRETRLAQITLLSPCPQCDSRLVVVRNSRTGKRFIGCTGRWEKNCTFSLPLPQIGALTLSRKSCAKCGFELVIVKARARRPMISCPMCFMEKRRKQAAQSRQTHSERHGTKDTA